MSMTNHREVPISAALALLLSSGGQIDFTSVHNYSGIPFKPRSFKHRPRQRKRNGRRQCAQVRR